VITSLANPAVKRIRGLARRREREAAGLFFVEGIRLVAQAADLGAPIVEVVLAPDLLHSEFARGVADRLAAGGVPVLEVSGKVFAGLSAKEGPQGIGAVVRQQWMRLEDISLAGSLCWIALDAVADPGNLGTILRTSDAVGAGGVILLGHTTDPYDPTAVRASMGAIFAQRLVRSDAADLARWAKGQGATIVGTSDRATDDYRTVTYPEKLILLMGSERQGLTEGMPANLMVRIPMVGVSDSLNLAVATGVVLYEIFSRRHPPHIPS